jgi:hypothetical protein
VLRKATSHPPNNSLMLTRLAGENAMVPRLPSCPRMRGRNPSRRAA